MKFIKIIAAALLSVLPATGIFAQNNTPVKKAESKTEIISVSGNCELCKSRIEKAAIVKGVSKADWSIETKSLTLVYDPKTVTADAIQKLIAAAGHDTEKFRAPDKAYKSLPGCCQYERKK